jgi:hypothetical protein
MHFKSHGLGYLHLSSRGVERVRMQSMARSMI